MNLRDCLLPLVFSFVTTCPGSIPLRRAAGQVQYLAHACPDLQPSTNPQSNDFLLSTFTTCRNWPMIIPARSRQRLEFTRLMLLLNSWKKTRSHLRIQTESTTSQILIATLITLVPTRLRRSPKAILSWPSGNVPVNRLL